MKVSVAASPSENRSGLVLFFVTPEARANTMSVKR